MMPNKAAKNIWIKKLSKKDRDMLALVRKELNTPFNNVAVLKAAYSYLEQKKSLDQNNVALEKAKQENLLLQDKYEELQKQIQEFFQDEREYEAAHTKKKDQLLKVSTIRTKIGRQGLSKLLR